MYKPTQSGPLITAVSVDLAGKLTVELHQLPDFGSPAKLRVLSWQKNPHRSQFSKIEVVSLQGPVPFSASYEPGLLATTTTL